MFARLKKFFAGEQHYSSLVFNLSKQLKYKDVNLLITDGHQEEFYEDIMRHLPELHDGKVVALRMHELRYVGPEVIVVHSHYDPEIYALLLNERKIKVVHYFGRSGLTTNWEERDIIAEMHNKAGRTGVTINSQYIDLKEPVPAVESVRELALRLNNIHKVNILQKV